MKHALLLAALVLPATVVLAHEGVKNQAVKARMDLMGQIAAETKVIGEMAKGTTPFDAARARAAAAAIADHSTRVPALFEAPEDDPKSEALPAIWEDFADFTRLTEEMEQAARRATGLETADDLAAALADLGARCKDCHKLYRE